MKRVDSGSATAPSSPRRNSPAAVSPTPKPVRDTQAAGPISGVGVARSLGGPGPVLHPPVRTADALTCSSPVARGLSLSTGPGSAAVPSTPRATLSETSPSSPCRNQGASATSPASPSLRARTRKGKASTPGPRGKPSATKVPLNRCEASREFSNHHLASESFDRSVDLDEAFGDKVLTPVSSVLQPEAKAMSVVARSDCSLPHCTRLVAPTYDAEDLENNVFHAAEADVQPLCQVLWEHGQAELEKTVSELEAEKSRLGANKTQLEGVCATISKLKTEVLELRPTCAKLEKAQVVLERLKIERAELHAGHAKLESAKSTIERLSAESAELRPTRAKLEEARCTIEKLRAEKAFFEASQSQLKEAQATIERDRKSVV